MRYDGKFSTTSLAQGGGEAMRPHIYSPGSPKAPSSSSIITITFKRKARVWGREVSLEWMSSQLPI
jgi:hypothetical protein